MSNYNNLFANQSEKLVSSLDISQAANINTQLYLVDNMVQDLSQDSINEIVKEMCNIYREKRFKYKHPALILDILEQFLIKKKQNPIDIINICLKDQINPMVQIILASCYQFGKWVEKDVHKAFTYYQKSAGMGSALGLNEIAVCYVFGIGVEKDEHKAFIYAQKSAEMGDANGIAGVGCCYTYGFGVEKDAHKAFIYYQKAAEIGFAGGTYKLGNCYQYGIGVEKDENKAFNYYRKSAEMESDDGMLSVAECYRCGIGVIRDLDKAKYWYQRGGFSTVYRAEWFDKLKYINRPVALKLVHDSNNYYKEFIRELKAYCDIGLKDPTFLSCFGVSKDKNSKDYFLVMEYALEGSLRKNLHAIAQVDWRDKLNLLQCIAYDLLIIHSQDLIHRDLHSGNILLNSLKSAYIADLGLSIAANIASKSNSDGIYGILPYIAPEVFNKHQYTKKSDIYSFSIIMWEILYGNPVSFEQKSELQLQLQVCNGVRPHIYENTAICYADLMKECWNMDPKKRPTSKEIYDTFTEWQNNETILLELSESDKKLQNIKNKDMQIDIESDYRSRFISFNSSYKYQGSKLHEFKIPKI